MTDSIISGLTAAGSLTGTEQVPVNQSGATKRTTVAAIVTLAKIAFVGDSGAGGAIGMVPAPSAGDAAAGKILGANGTWVDPPDKIATRRNFIGVMEDEAPLTRATRREFASATIS